MKSKHYEAKPWSIQNIRDIASHVRKSIGLKDSYSVDLRYVLDVLSIVYRKHKFNYAVVPDDDKRFKSNEEAHTDISDGRIYIKESVYLDLSNLSSRSNFTVAHEIGHYFLHHLLGFVLSRKNSPDKTYLDPEWQANQFAAEFLMPYNAVKSMTVSEIYNNYNVSYVAALIRYKKINK